MWYNPLVRFIQYPITITDYNPLTRKHHLHIMMDLRPVWEQVEQMLRDGVSVIPVRDKAEGDFGPKTPYAKWKVYQTIQITKEDLWHQMEQRGTSAVAMICGKISGNLEVIDIDVKWKPGIDAQYFTAIQQLRPDLWDKLRIHRSPSGGFHILYRVAYGVIPGNLKLAKRPPNEAEILADPKARPVCYIETRGEGGYVLAPPSLGYSVQQLRVIPIISWEDRESLIALARLTDEIPKLAPAPPRPKQQSEYYQLNPWDAFNQSPAGETVLQDAGWKYAGRGGDYTHYTRPGKDKGISGSFIHSRRLYYIFTSNGGVDAERGYNPSTLLSDLVHNGDRKATFRWLVNSGYGVINPKIEARIVRKAAITGKELPANASPAARVEHLQAVTEAHTAYPYGLFWTIDEDDKLVISRERLLSVASDMGFRLYQSELVRIIGPVVHKIEERDFYDTLKSYIKEEDREEYCKIADAVESFLQRAGAFTITRLGVLPRNAMLHDTANICWKAYSDVVVKITPTEIVTIPYQSLPALVWHQNIQPRIWSTGTSGKYIQFLQHAVAYNTHAEYVNRIIGYLSHEYKDSATPYVIVLTEQCEDPKDGGGSGKNVFCNLLRNTTSVISKAGSQAKFDERFFQVWNGERVFVISDVPKKFDFLFLKELSSGSGVLKKLFKDERVIAVEDMMKFIVNTNYSVEISDGGLRRRIIPLEFTDFFTRAGGIDNHFGCMFPDGASQGEWTPEDWAGYDGTVVTGIQSWLAAGRKLQPTTLSETGWKKQFEQTYGAVITKMIDQLMPLWLQVGFISADDFRKQVDSFYTEQGIYKTYQPAIERVGKAIKYYCAHNSIPYQNESIKRTFVGLTRGRQFGDEEAPF